MSKKKAPINPRRGVDIVHYRIRFQCKDLAKIESAAARRGLSTQEFIRLVCGVAADKFLALPPVDVFNEIHDVLTSSTPAQIAG
jgi:hypothetical protein